MFLVTTLAVKWKILLLFCYLANCVQVTGAENPRQIDPVIQKKIDNFVQNIYLPYSGVSGLGLAIVQNDGELLYTTGYGYADHEKGIPNGNKTQFLLGSVSKSFTALLVIKTLHEHFPELDEEVLDTPIRQLLPQINFTVVDRVRSEHATFRDLLSHKMCLPRDDFQLLVEPFSSTSEIVYRQRYAEESCGFRSKFVYNNHMVLIASDLISQLVNQNFVDYAESLLRQLGMHDSAFIKRTDDFSNMPYRAKPYYIKNQTNYPINPDLIKRLVYSQAVGGLYVTPNDMSRFIRFQLNMGKIDGEQLVPEKVMSWLTKPSNSYPRITFKKTNEDSVVESHLAYGLGLLVGTHNSWQQISHNGYFPSYRSEMAWYPALNLGIFSSSHEVPLLVKKPILQTFIFETLRGNENAEEIAIEFLKQEGLAIEKERKGKNKVLQKFLGHYKNFPGQKNINDTENQVVGKYGSKVSGEVEISRKYNSDSKRFELYLSHGKWAKGWLESIGISGLDDDGGDERNSNGDTEAFKVNWSTDIIQDYYAAGDMDEHGYVTVTKDGTLEFLIKQAGYGMFPLAQFKRGVKVAIDELNPVPWKKDSC